MKTVIAEKTGFYGGSLVFSGQSLEVEDDLAASWFAPQNPPAEAEPIPLGKSRKKVSEEAAVT